MGAIFGCINKGPTVTADFVQSLKKWNEPYGETGSFSPAESDIFLGYRTNRVNQNQVVPENIIEIGDFAGVADALIYNREEIEPMLADPKASSLSHAELLIRFVIEKGFDALKSVNGDFTGAVYNKATKELVLFRDHMGIRPLFFYNKDGLLAFSTDLRGIVGLPGVDHSPDEKYVYLSSMGYNHLTLCGTSYAHITCVRQAAWTVCHPFDGSNIQTDTHIFWKMKQKKVRMKNREAYIAEMRRLITDSLSRRLKVTSGPIGCELSGGLDSSVLAILASRLGYEGRFFSWSWSPEEFPLCGPDDERHVIQDICKQENITCRYARKRNFTEETSFHYLLTQLEVPYINTRTITEGSEWMHSEGARVVLSGHGGDEGVSHRCNLFELWYHREYWHFLVGLYRGTEGTKWRIPCFVYRLFRQLFIVHPHFSGAYSNENNNQAFMNAAFLEKMKNTKRLPLTFAYDPARYYMQGGPRIRLDNTAVQGADVGMQYLFPFLDYRVFDYAVSIPRYLYKSGRGNRWIYRKAFDDIMPDALRNVHYKDVPSTRNYNYEDSRTPEVIEMTKKDSLLLTEMLSKEPWNRYFVFTALKDTLEKENWADEDWSTMGDFLNIFSSFAYMQNLKDNIGRK